MKMRRISVIIICFFVTATLLHAEIKKVRIDNPSRWTTGQMSQYVGDTIQFETPFYVVNNYSMSSGKLSVSPRRIMIPTNQEFPASIEYSAMVHENTNGHVYLKLPAGNYRTGQQIKNLTVIVESKNDFKAYGEQTFYGNKRQANHDDIGDYTLKVCAFNLQIYLASNYGTSYGPANAFQVAAQHEKIMKALKAIDADIYGFSEIQQGQGALDKIVKALNKNVSSDKHYAYINDGGKVNGSWTKVAYVYRKSKVEPYKSLLNDETRLSNRKKVQAFRQKSNNEVFVYSINHFKAKSGKGRDANADQGDGQGNYNADRVSESEAVLELFDHNKSMWNDSDVLVMGDLNAYAMEDPIQKFVDNNFVDLHRVFHADSAYTYTYYNRSTKVSEAGYLDYALASESMKNQVTGVTVFHINADEHKDFAYAGKKNDGSMYRSSDHDPVIVGLALGNHAANDIYSDVQKLQVNMNEYNSGEKPLTIKNAKKSQLYIYNNAGIVRLHEEINVSSYIVETSKFTSGIYIMYVFGEKTMKQIRFTVK